MNQIERLLLKESCVGSLDHWSRSYAYDEDVRAKAVYPELVSFHLEEAGAYGVEPGLHIADQNTWSMPNDKPIKMASGHYDVPSEKLVFSYCGNNVGGSTQPTDINRMNDYYGDLRRRRAEIAVKRR